MEDTNRERCRRQSCIGLQRAIGLLAVLAAMHSDASAQPTLAKELIYIDGCMIAIESPTTSGAAPPTASEVTVTGLKANDA